MNCSLIPICTYNYHIAFNISHVYEDKQRELCILLTDLVDASLGTTLIGCVADLYKMVFRFSVTLLEHGNTLLSTICSTPSLVLYNPHFFGARRKAL